MDKSFSLTEVVVFINTFVVFMGFLSSLIFYPLKRNNEAYKYNFILWSGILLTHGTQGALNPFPDILPSAFATGSIFCYASAKILGDLFNFQVIGAVKYFSLVFVLATIGFFIKPYTAFWVVSLPIVMWCLYPMAAAVIKAVSLSTISLSSWASWTIVIVCAFTIVHQLTYPFLRLNLDYAPFGFIIGSAIGFFLSVAVPVALNEKGLKDRNLELEAAVTERTEQLKETHARVRSLLRVVCHDIANPMSVISFTNSALNKEIKKIESATSLNQSLKRMTGLQTKCGSAIQKIREILDFTRIVEASDSGKMELTLVSSCMKSMAETLIDGFSYRILQKNIQLDLQLEPALAMLDRVVFSNIVLSNILSNAIKFTPKGGTIRITTGTSETGKAYASIEDRGMGIPDEIKERLFDPEARTSRGGTDGEMGTGFGMPLVLDFVRRMHGDLVLDTATEASLADSSRSSSGTQITVYFELSNQA